MGGFFIYLTYQTSLAFMRKIGIFSVLPTSFMFLWMNADEIRASDEGVSLVGW